jgi:secreted Zn-dependent insulinase-like peptidase
MSLWQVSEQNYEAIAVLKVVESLLKEDIFDVLRNKEQLGYVVLSHVSIMRAMIHYAVII